MSVSVKISFKHASKMFFNMPDIYTPPTTLHQGRKVRFHLPNFPCVSGTHTSIKLFTQSTANITSVHPLAHPMPAFPIICKQLLSKGCATFLKWGLEKK